MKWILLSALALTSSIYSATPKNQPPAKCDPETMSCDLFRRAVPVYTADAEILCWTVAEGALDYALKMEHPAWGPSSYYAQGDFQRAAFDWDPGFRVAIQYFRAPHFWEMRWQYTRATFRGDNVIHAPNASDEFLLPTWPPIFTGAVSKAKSRLHMNYNVFDWSVDRVFFPNEHLRVRLLSALAVAWLDQDWKVRYFSGADTTIVHNKWSFAGGGLKVGGIFDWYIYKDFYLSGVGVFGLFLGSYDNHAKQTTSYKPDISDNTSIPVRDAKYGDLRGVVNAQMSFGPSWQKAYSSSRIEVFSGFEMNVWSNLQEVYRSTATSVPIGLGGGLGSLPPTGTTETWMNTGLVTLYGVTTRVTIDF